MHRLVALLIPLAAVLSSCTTVSKLSDEDLASYVQLGAEQAAKYGLKLALDKNPADAAKITADVGIAVDAIDKVVLPAFQGAGTGDVLRSAVDQALEKLDAKLSPMVKIAIQGAVDIASVSVKLPDNPTDKLDARTKKALVALFQGLEAGMKAATATREVGPPAKLAWPKKK